MVWANIRFMPQKHPAETNRNRKAITRLSEIVGYTPSGIVGYTPSGIVGREDPKILAWRNPLRSVPTRRIPRSGRSRAPRKSKSRVPISSGKNVGVPAGFAAIRQKWQELNPPHHNWWWHRRYRRLIPATANAPSNANHRRTPKAPVGGSPEDAPVTLWRTARLTIVTARDSRACSRS